MHIPDGYISPQTAGGLWAMMVPVWYTAGYKVKKTLSSRQAPLVAIGAAFSFVIMMFNIPLPGGTTGHAVGGTLVAVVLGPWAAVISLTVALVIQAIFFGDGGILAIGANCFNIAFALPVSGYYVYRLISMDSAPGSSRRWIAAGAGAYVGINVAALLTAVEVGLQGELFLAADGSALYSPYVLSQTVPAMMIAHLAIVGLLEAAVTSSAVLYLQRTDISLLNSYSRTVEASRGSFKLKPLIIGVVLLLVFAPLGLLATGTAWGEWSPEDIQREVGFVPEGMRDLAGLWTGVLPDYAIPGQAESGFWASVPGYLISGAFGLLVIGGGAWLVIWLIARRNNNGRNGSEEGGHEGKAGQHG
ncbi:MAG: cobalt transporter CbiM [Thermoleophilia bacterium]